MLQGLVLTSDRSIAVQASRLCYSLERMRSVPHSVREASFVCRFSEVLSMQRFIAELSASIEEADFERSWCSDQSFNDKQLR